LQLSFRIVAAVFALASLAAPPALADCNRTAWNLGAGASGVQTSWTLTTDSQCQQTIRGGNGPLGYLDNLRISQQAAHGLAGVSNSIADHGIAYKPNARYVGGDHFQVTADRHYDWKATTELATIDVNIQVVAGAAKK
jgi:opacity protein-like surface antigen